MDVSNNHLVGGIGSFLGELGELERLQLHNNSFVGEIPPELESLGNLDMVTFHENDLEGEVPPGLCDDFLSRLSADCEEVTNSCCTEC